MYNNIPDLQTVFRAKGNDLALKAAVVLLYADRKGRITIPLLERCSQDGDTWIDFAGGKLELRDRGNLQRCAVREAWEELGVGILPEDLIDIGPHAKFGSTLPVHYFYCTLAFGEPRNMLPREHKALRLCTPKEAIDLLGDRTTPKVRDFIRLYDANTAPINFPSYHVAS